jgi:serine/threonine-protein kinase
MTAAPDRHLLFGLLALQNGLIDQGALVAAFQAWTRDKSKSLADHLEARGDLTGPKRAALEAFAAVHIEAHGGDVQQSLAAVPANRSTRASLVDLGEPEIEATLARVALAKNGQATEIDGDDDDDPDRSAGLSLGAATSDGQRFRILRPHARGGLGEVFVALDAELHREVALKQILEKHADDPVSRQRFVAEAEITGGLEHPGIVPVYGLGTYGSGRPYYAMRFIKGESLKEAIQAFHEGAGTKSPSPPRGEGAPSASLGAGRRAGEGAAGTGGSRDLELRKLLRRFLDVCNAVDYAHSRGVIHRDLKPANIILGKHGETLVVDWGLAKAVGRADPSVGEQTIAPSSSGSSETLPGSALGTPAYMSPEQASGDLDRLGPRSDVYALGATLYCLLTGKPPFDGEDVGEILRRVQAGDVRAPREVDPSLDAALEAVCTKAMATKLEGRYSGCQALAEDIERWMADEPVSAYREPLPRRARRWAKRNRTIVATAAVALLAGVVGLSAVLVVQTQAKADIARALVRETQARTALAESNAKVQARYELAEKAIKTFHTGVSEDFLLKNEEFKELRTKLLKEAAGFYADLETLLAGQNDARSRKALAAAYFQLGELTDKIGDKREALAVQRKALAVRRELAAAPGADVETRLDVPRSLMAVAKLLISTGDPAGALSAVKERRDLAAALEVEAPTYAVRTQLASGHIGMGFFLNEAGKPAEALLEYQQALAIQQKLADANPAVTEVQSILAKTHHNIGQVLDGTGKPTEALQEYQQALAIWQKLADANPAVTEVQSGLWMGHFNIGNLLKDVGRLTEAVREYKKALEIVQKLADVNPAVTEFQSRRAWGHFAIGNVLSKMGKPAEALEEYQKALAGFQRLAGADLSIAGFQRGLASTHEFIGNVLSQTGKPAEAMKEYQKALAVQQKLADANPAATYFQSDLARSHRTIGNGLLQMGKLAEAMEEYQKALAISKKLVDAQPTVPTYQDHLSESHTQLGRLLARQQRFAEAFTTLDAGLAIHQKLAEAEPKNTDRTVNLGYSYAWRGWALVRSRQPSKAAADLRRALELWAKLPHLEITTHVDRSRALALLAGLGGDAKSGVTKDEASTFANQSVAALAAAVKAGWALPSELKEPDFDAVRGRDDFRKLVAEVEAKTKPKANTKD